MLSYAICPGYLNLVAAVVVSALTEGDVGPVAKVVLRV